ncbi:hypothetical protein [Kordiimonas aquimaris]|nr:hypothetical protein [Kordiimonas aquimaris]
MSDALGIQGRGFSFEAAPNTRRQRGYRYLRAMCMPAFDHSSQAIAN